MNELLKLFIIFYFIWTSSLISDDNLTKFPTEEEWQQLRARLDDPNDKEAQEAKKAANYFKTLIAARKDAGVKDGHTPTREQELVIMDAAFPLMQEDALKKGQRRMNFSQQCFLKADTLARANICNEQANKLSGFIIDNFNEWNNEIKLETLKSIKHYVPCIQNSKTAEELNDCYVHIYK